MMQFRLRLEQAGALANRLLQVRHEGGADPRSS